MKKNVLSLWACLLICISTTSIIAHSEDKLEELQNLLISDDAYQAILQFYQYNKNIPLDPILIRKSETDEYTLEKIAFKGANGLLVPAYFAVPKKGAPPYPCILQLHGMTLSKEVWWKEDGWHKGPPLSPKLLEEGFAVLAIDYPLHGDRSILNKFENTYLTLIRQRKIYKFRNLVINGVIDSRRALDYLGTREEIDSTRLGVVGSSLGGTMSLILTGVDSRIKVATVLVSIVLISPIYEGQPDISSILPINFIRGFDKQPLLMLMGNNDESQYTVKEARALFDLVEGDAKEIVFYDCGHRLPEEHVLKAFEWFQNHLK